MTYRQAGVNVDAASALVEQIRPLAESTNQPGAMGGIGGFGGLFDLAAVNVEEPVLVAATDGVGTKLLVAGAMGCHDTIGIDLVAMCVNDVVVQGARPLFFLDYFSTGKLEPPIGLDVIKGIAAGCREAGCVLIGGETAEMPGMYAAGSYDLAGFSVGLVSRSARLPRSDIEAGDVLLGLSASGVHANGISLVRHVLERQQIAFGDAAPFGGGRSWGMEILTPTRIYVRACLQASERGLVKALCHITGGGLLENLPRILPPDMAAIIDAADWPGLPLFNWLRQEGGIETRELARTFNCGIGMIAIVEPALVDETADLLTQAGEDVHRIGEIRATGSERVSIASLEAAWKN